MVGRNEPLSGRPTGMRTQTAVSVSLASVRLWGPGVTIGVALLLLIVVALTALLSVDSGSAAGSGGLDLFQDRYVWAVLRFALLEASVSAALSVGLAIPIARALSRRPRFPGRWLLVRLMGLPMVIPVIVGTLGIIAVYGRGGWLNDGLESLGLPVQLNLYGLQGILVAHVFFNLPFATRILLQGWSGIPAETWRLADQLGLRGWPLFRLIEAPMLRQIVPGLAGFVFLVCFTSFAIVLMVGGGPPHATLEVAIYQALRFDFDLVRVSALSLLQVTVCVTLVLALAALSQPMPVTLGLDHPIVRRDGDAWHARLVDSFAIGVALLIMIPPLAALLWDTVGGPWITVLTDLAVWAAMGRSAVVALASGTLALALGLGVIATSRAVRVRLHKHRWADTVEAIGTVTFVMPPLVLGAGLFVLLRGVADVFAIGLALVVLVNALMGLPFIIRIVGPAADQALATQGRLADSLGMAGFHRFRLVDWPPLRRPIGLGLAMVTALSMGDFGVIALFGTQDTQTLPMLLFRLMGAYRLDQAAVVAVVLLALCLAFFLVIERQVGGRRRD